VFPGEIEDGGMLASPWTPPEEDEPIGHAVVWSAFDCAQLWALMVNEPSDVGERIVTAELRGTMVAPVLAGEPHVVTAWSLGRSGGKLQAGAALHDSAGRLRAFGLQTAVVAKWGVPLDFLAQR
jgi:hypothetical protein